MKKQFWSADRIVSFVAMFISLTTLIIFVRQTNIMDQQSRLSLMPYLAVGITNNGAEHYHAIIVYNYGVGPAIIEKVKIFHRGKTMEMDFADFAHQMIHPQDSIDILSSSSLESGLAIPAGEERRVLKIGGSEKAYVRFQERLEQLYAEGFDFEIQYRSIYHDRWKITDSMDFPEEL